MTKGFSVAVVGSGFAGSLIARVLAVMGHDVVLFERGAHPRFAIGESTTPLANLSLERLADRYGLADCRSLAAHGRWLRDYPRLRRGLKRGFTFYRHEPGRPFEDAGLDSPRLLVAASPNDGVADSHWLRADVDEHFVHEAVAAGVEYRDRTELTGVAFGPDGARLSGRRCGVGVDVRVDFVIDATGPGGFLAKQLGLPSGAHATATRSSLVFGHFENVRPMHELLPGLPEGPYPDDWAAVHHILDEGWMYSLRFDDGLTSAGFALTPGGLASMLRAGACAPNPDTLWRALLDRYPTLAAAFRDATPTMRIRFVPSIQHRLTQAVGERWALLPHAYAFVDPLFSTGIAWSVRAVERLASCFAAARPGHAPPAERLCHYEMLMAREADQIDQLVAGAYDAMDRFDLFAAHAMIYFATVSYAEVRQRLLPDADVAWQGFLGVGDEVLEPVPREARARLREGIEPGEYRRWVAEQIAPRNVAGLADPARHNLYPVDLDVLLERHALLGLSRDQLSAALPRLRGMALSS